MRLLFQLIVHLGSNILQNLYLKLLTFYFFMQKILPNLRLKYYTRREYDTAYKFILKERTADYKKWAWVLVADETANRLGFENANKAKRSLGKADFEKAVAEYAIENCERVFRTASVTGGALQKEEQPSRNQKQIETE